MTDDEMIKLIHSMFRSHGTGGLIKAGICCPYCDEESSYVHMQKPQYKPAADYEAAKLYDINTRGSVTILNFSCESGHSWALIFGEHKGGIPVKIVLTSMPEGEEYQSDPFELSDLRPINPPPPPGTRLPPYDD